MSTVMPEAAPRRRRVRPAPRQEETVVKTTVQLKVEASGFNVAKDERTVLEVTPFAVEPAYIRVNAGTTKSLGPYESLRLDVSLSVPCYVEEIATVFPRVADAVAGYLADEIANYAGANEGEGEAPP